VKHKKTASVFVAVKNKQIFHEEVRRKDVRSDQEMGVPDLQFGLDSKVAKRRRVNGTPG
jgi:hypothetical protein